MTKPMTDERLNKLREENKLLRVNQERLQLELRGAGNEIKQQAKENKRLKKEVRVLSDENIYYLHVQELRDEVDRLKEEKERLWLRNAELKALTEDLTNESYLVRLRDTDRKHFYGYHFGTRISGPRVVVSVNGTNFYLTPEEFERDWGRA